MKRLGLLGYGRMGQAVEAAWQREPAGLELIWTLDAGVTGVERRAHFARADVVIEFTRPEAALTNVMELLEQGVAVVSGTTGWKDSLPRAEAFCRERGGSLLWAPNFSPGVNLFLAIAAYAAQRLGAGQTYRPSITETHHTGKLDAPSGTAIALAAEVLPAFASLKGWSGGQYGGNTPVDTLPIHSLREPGVPGTHALEFAGADDSLTLVHTAHSREGFARGALIAAHWLPGRKGVFSMRDVLGIPATAGT
jgi:4-hydroxy-tetrahydrodipicolinate reductase